MKTDGNSNTILGVTLNSTQVSRVLEKIEEKIEANKKLWIVTPNSEFIVAASEDSGFKSRLNKADLSLPDGVGLIWAMRFLKKGSIIKTRITGADVVEEILKEAPKKGWSLGVIGARRGNEEEAVELIGKLERRHPGLKIENLETTEDWERKNYDIIFACQGMKKQEEWIDRNLQNSKAKVFIGVGGALDFFAGFSKRAPLLVRRLGLEWLWRLVNEPWRLRRQLKLIKFIWLVIKNK